MKTIWMLVAIAVSLAGAVTAQENLPVPGYEPAKDLPGAHLTPDPGTEYKVMFDLTKTAENLDEPYPMLPFIATYVNTLAHLGVPKEKRKIAVVLHQGSGLIGLTNEAFKKRNDGHDNPNIALIKALHAAGVSFHLCGQGVLMRKLEKTDLLDEIQVDYWALTTIIELGRQGYVKIG